MPDGDGAAVDVELVLVESKLAGASHHLRAEGLVDLEAIDVSELAASAGQHSLNCRHRADTHHRGRHADRGAGKNARQWLLAESARIIARADQDRRRAVDDGRGTVSY